MDPELKSEFKNLHSKIDGYTKHIAVLCKIKHEVIDAHLKDAPGFRDKIVKLSESLRINWVLTIMMVSGIIGGFFWLIRKL